ncbi:hypothetical protein THRCLA_21372 [Thraustotheca clavata]|uniref:Uncharacterized protein n=1 Tax=Thraustotheca clavata TaxID=74557 RepID=A0A1V9ZX56_9STRA|nr:hypothetical protein THRCLA_21372 [Thraustotheca clavata]
MTLNSEGYDEVAQQNPSEHAITLPAFDPEVILQDEVKQLLSLTAPIILTYILGYLPGIMALILVGHID